MYIPVCTMVEKILRTRKITKDWETKIAIYRSSPETVYLICSFMQFMFNQV